MNCVFAYTNERKEIAPSWYKKYYSALVSGDILKISGLVGRFVLNIGIYIIFTTISSTQWYFYTQASKAEEKAKFTNNIANFNVLTRQSDIWNGLNNAFSNGGNTIIEITAATPISEELTALQSTDYNTI